MLSDTGPLRYLNPQGKTTVLVDESGQADLYTFKRPAGELLQHFAEKNGLPIQNPEHKEEAEQPFTDVTPGHWAADDISWGKNYGIIDGFEDGAFRPDEPVRQLHFAAMMFRAFQFMPGGRPDDVDKML
ncbi:S-layer homology domain-containing protein [Paenibacillus hamazuiensis]|uniref:S-layer homology domain-containing protein n=1 Tax=Paenibacillus hamazuiensis TaxID=2936508 RepID=UPI00200D1E36|nr:S-layer homology domain-containing protein [Paenibacillus hamazuiensis]